MNKENEILVDDLDKLMNESLPFIPVDLFPSTDDMTFLNNKIEQLTVDVNTQNLKIELGRLKRRKLGSTVWQLKGDLLSLRQTVEQVQAENNLMKEQIATLSNAFFRTHCCLSRLHQVLISIVYIVMPVEEHREVSQLIYKLLRAT